MVAESGHASIPKGKRWKPWVTGLLAWRDSGLGNRFLLRPRLRQFLLEVERIFLLGKRSGLVKPFANHHGDNKPFMFNSGTG